MAHDHHHSHGHDCHAHTADPHSLDRKLAVAAWLNGVIVIVEIVGGVLSGSVALLSDALHNLSDVLALVMAWGARILGRRPATARHTFGLRRLEVVAAFVNALTILAAAAFIIKEAVERLLHPTPISSGIMLAVAVVGLVANLASVLLLGGHRHDDLNVRGAFLHLVLDTVSSVAVVAAALLANTRIGPWLDPIVSLLVVAFVLRGSWDLLSRSLRVLLEATPPDLDLTAVQSDLATVAPACRLEHLHAWELTPGQTVLTADVVSATASTPELCTELASLRHRLAEKWGVAHATLQPIATPASASTCPIA